MNIEHYKNKAKAIKKQFKDDFIVQYFCNSIARTKNDFNNVANIGTLHAYLIKTYNLQLVD